MYGWLSAFDLLQWSCTAESKKVRDANMNQAAAYTGMQPPPPTPPKENSYRKKGAKTECNPLEKKRNISQARSKGDIKQTVTGVCQ